MLYSFGLCCDGTLLGKSHLHSLIYSLFVPTWCRKLKTEAAQPTQAVRVFSSQESFYRFPFSSFASGTEGHRSEKPKSQVTAGGSAVCVCVCGKVKVVPYLQFRGSRFQPGGRCTTPASWRFLHGILPEIRPSLWTWEKYKWRTAVVKRTLGNVEKLGVSSLKMYKLLPSWLLVSVSCQTRQSGQDSRYRPVYS